MQHSRTDGSALPEDPAAEEARIKELRKKLDDPRYVKEAVQGLANELTVEIMENTYGISFH